MRRSFIWRISKLLVFTTAAIGLCSLSVAETAKNGTYILDRTGENWDISQAESIGFKPGGFQYGITKDR